MADKATVRRIVDMFNKSGWNAYYHPRKRQVTLNGYRTLPEDKAIKEMLRLMSKEEQIP